MYTSQSFLMNIFTHARILDHWTCQCSCLHAENCVWHCLTLDACYQIILKIGFALAKKCGTGGGGEVSAQGAVHMAAALASCRG